MSQIGQEVPILELQAAVYNYDGNTKNWAPKDGGSSRVWIFHNTTTNAYRVIGQSLTDKQYNINSPVKSELVHKKLRENFLQWRFRQTIFGLSFQSAEDTDKFEAMLVKILDSLGPATPPPAVAAGATTSVAQQAASASIHPSGAQTLHRQRSATGDSMPPPVPTTPSPGSAGPTLGGGGGSQLRPPAMSRVGSSPGFVGSDDRRRTLSQSAATPPSIPALRTLPTTAPVAASGGASGATTSGAATAASPPGGGVGGQTSTAAATLASPGPVLPPPPVLKTINTGTVGQGTGLRTGMLARNGSFGEGLRNQARRDVRSMEISALALRASFAEQAGGGQGGIATSNTFESIGSASAPVPTLASPSGRSNTVGTNQAPLFTPVALPATGSGIAGMPSGLTQSSPLASSGSAIAGSTDPKQQDQRRTQSMYQAPGANYSTNSPAHLATLRGPSTPGAVRPGEGHEPQPAIPTNALYAKDNKELSKRDYRAKEIYTSEESYLAGLDIVIEEYLRPAKAKGVFNEKEIRAIFSNVEQIRDLSRELLLALKAQMSNWTPESTVGEIFLKKMPFMKIYIPYCRDHKGANELLEDKKNTKRMSLYLRESQTNSKLQLDLNALLITPVQRVLRYPLLLKALLEVTEEAHPDYQHLLSSLEQIQKIADEINQSVEVSESTKAVHELSKQIPNIHRMISTTRQLVKHGPVQVTSVKKGAYTYLLLFSDVAVFACPSQKNSKKLEMKEKVHLERVWVDGMKDTSSAEVTWQMNSPDATYLIQSAGKEDKTLWVDKCQQRVLATCHKKMVIEDPTQPERRKFLYKYKEGPKATYEGYWLDAKYDGQGKLTLHDQTIYEGTWERGKAHGTGKITYMTGEIYDGQWYRDKPHWQGTLASSLSTYTGGWELGRKQGTGSIRWANGDAYEGDFVADMREGTGTLKSSDGSEYSGQWKADQYHGNGKLSTKFGGTYEGEWVNGRKQGQGTLTYTNGDVYSGEWVDDYREGKGTFTQADGKVRYEGEWKEDAWEGQGVLVKPDYRYEGEFKGGRLYGNGTLTTPEGNYSGGWAEDRREGKGKWTGSNGEVYDGEYHSDLRFGKGTWIDSDGARYDGKWVKGRKEGTGVFTYPNGAKYSGGWQRDRRHGQGVWSGADETSKYVGDWVNDMREGKGVFTDPTGSYNGEWLRDMRNGQGVLTYGGGITYTGNWKDDRRHGTGVLRISKQGQPDVTINMNYENGLLIEPPFTNAPPDIVLPRLFVQK